MSSFLKQFFDGALIPLACPYLDKLMASYKNIFRNIVEVAF